MIILDANALVKLTVADPKTDDDALRLQGMLDRAAAGGIVVGIPAPAFAEFLVRADDATIDILSAFELIGLIHGPVLPFQKHIGRRCNGC